MLTCTMGNIRVWRTCDPGARRHWIAGADAYLPYREQWQMIRWESYATPEERDRRYEDLIDGFRFGATERELEDDRLFWKLYVEGAPAEAEAR